MGFETTQPSLLSRVRDPEDRLAWRQFDDKYRELILRYCRRKGLQQADAEDVRQIVMMNLSRALPKFHYRPKQGRFRSYLGTVVRNAISHHMSRPSSREKPLDTSVLTSLPEVTDDADDVWEVEWANHHYRLAMKSVRETFEARSIAVFDRLLVGDSVAQVADSFGLSTQAVHKVKQRIRLRLNELIQQQIADEDEPNSQVHENHGDV